jgi:Ser/Thr protein kinase RdoA (MazF antagonist)
VPDDDLLRSLLRDQWHLVPSEVEALDGGLMSRAWEVRSGCERYVARLVDEPARQPVEAGLAAAEHLRGWGIEVGAPVRTLGGSLTGSTSSGGATGWASCTGCCRTSSTPGCGRGT